MKSAFVDSNVLLYAADGRPAEADKAAAARQLLAQGSFCLSVQVINEFTAVATHPRKLGMSREDAVLYCECWTQEYEVHPLTVVHLEMARTWFLPGTLSWWDSLILASANFAGCEQLYSEDLHSGAVYGQVKVINPFPA